MVIIYVTIGLFILYAILIFYYWFGWLSIPLFRQKSKAALPISVIIPARNEERTIGMLLQALMEQDHPKELTEIIVIDDHSADQTVSVAQQFPNTSVISLLEDDINSYKKKAIEAGISAAKGQLIITTDADCLPQPGWLSEIASFKEERNAMFVAAPVNINCGNSIVEVFQAMDFMMLQGITGAAVQRNRHAMCNGANLSYEREAFHSVNGFDGIDSIASGDDMLLMHKISQAYPGRSFYLKSQQSIVTTEPVRSWREFFSQRIRWASKSRFYKDRSITAVLAFVYLINLSFLILFIAGFWRVNYWNWIPAFWLAKTIIELPFFISVARFFRKTWTIPFFPFFQPLHVGYTIIAGLLSQFGTYQWKGRTVK